MNAQARPVLAGNRARLAPSVVTVAVTLVLATVALAACSGSPFSQAAPDNACANRLAQAAISGSVPGLWNCLTPDFQSKLNQIGVSGDGGIVPQPFASSYTLIGATANEVSYELTLTPQMAQQQGFHYMALVVWVDRSGKIIDFSAGNSPT